MRSFLKILIACSLLTFMIWSCGLRDRSSAPLFTAAEADSLISVAKIIIPHPSEMLFKGGLRGVDGFIEPCEAIQIWEKARRKKGDDREMLLQLGRMYLLTRKHEKAKGVYLSVLSMDAATCIDTYQLATDKANAHWGLGCLFFALGELDSAIGEFKTYSRRHQNVWINYNIALTYLRRGETDSSDEILKSIGAKGGRTHGVPFPYNDAQYLLVYSLSKKGKDLEAVDLYFDALINESYRLVDDSVIYLEMIANGVHKFDARNLDKKLSAINAVKSDASLSGNYFYAGMTYALAGQLDQAIKFIKESIKCGHHQGMAWYCLSLLYKIANEEKLSGRALEMASENNYPTALLIMAKRKYFCGQRGTAKVLLGKCADVINDASKQKILYLIKRI